MPEFSLAAFGRLLGVLLSPGETFSQIAARPTWLAPLLFSLAVSIATLGLFADRVGWERYLLRQAEQSEEWQKLSETERERQAEGIRKFAAAMPWISTFGAAVQLPLIVAIGGGLLLFAFNSIAGADLTFKTSLAIFSHGIFPLLGIAGLLGLVVLLLKDPATIDLENLVASNAGVLLESGASRRARALATSLDIFSIWSVALLAIGYRAANPRRISMAMSAGIVLGVWLIGVMAKLGLVSLFGR
jgi:uncharacterized membrane protein SpoIIM required for sporulation